MEKKREKNTRKDKKRKDKKRQEKERKGKKRKEKKSDFEETVVLAYLINSRFVLFLLYFISPYTG